MSRLASVLLFVFVSAVLAFAQPAEESEPFVLENSDPVRSLEKYPYVPRGFIAEVAYAGPTVLSASLYGGREFPLKHRVLFGFSWIAADVDFDEGKVSDEGILGVAFFISSLAIEHSFDVIKWLSYFVNGDTYYPLTEGYRIGVFETHHIVDYLIYGLCNAKSWEFGFSEAVGLRFVYAKGNGYSTYYLDLGANVRLTNKAFRFGVFVQLGLSGIQS